MKTNDFLKTLTIFAVLSATAFAQNNIKNENGLVDNENFVNENFANENAEKNINANAPANSAKPANNFSLNNGTTPKATPPTNIPLNMPSNKVNTGSFNNVSSNVGTANAYPSGVIAPTNNAVKAPAAPMITNVPSNSLNNTNLVNNQMPDPERQAFEMNAADIIRKDFAGDLEKYCGEYCQILSIRGRAREVFNTSTANLGFENVAPGSASGRKFQIQSVDVTVLVDTRFGNLNVERLEKLFAGISKKYHYPTIIRWEKTLFPESTSAAKSEAELRQDVSQQIRNQLERIIVGYCPTDCRLHEVDVQISRAGVDELQNGSSVRYLFTRDGKGALYIKGTTVRLSVNDSMEKERKKQIETLFREHLSSYGTLNLSIKEYVFPDAAEEVQKDMDERRNDPYSINKFEKLLKLFKDYASVKEIYKETDSRTTTSEKNSETSSESSQSSSSSSESEKSSNSKEGILNSQFGFLNKDNMMLIGGIIVTLIIAAAIGLRFVISGKRVRAAVEEGRQGLQNAAAAFIPMAGQGMGGPTEMRDGRVVHRVEGNGFSSHIGDEVSKHFEISNLRDEIIQVFVSQPKVAREVFTRSLREDGVESTAKYVAIFGEMVVFELLGNTDLKADLATLAEYVHVNLPQVSLEEQLDLLKKLKLRITAGKMKLLSNKTMDVFDFIKSRSPRQIFELILDESSKCQAIVLTQLPTEKRREIFELFEGSVKVDLLRELSSGDIVPKEYLMNVAEALKRKALHKPNFDGENVRGTDVLMDLLERADLQQQRELLAELDNTNPEAAKLLRSRLVTIEILPYLRDGLLIEIFLNMESETMAAFLRGAKDTIRNLIFSKAPQDIAQVWAESMEAVQVDMEAYRLAEMQVISKVRQFASSSLINLSEVNQALYPRQSYLDTIESANRSNQRTFRINNPLVA